MANMTLFDLYTLRRNDSYTGLIEDVTTLAPEFSTVTAVPRPGVSYEIVSRTALPSVSFGVVGGGTTPSKSSYKKMTKEMFLLQGLINMPTSIVKADDSSVGSAWQLETAGIIRNTSIKIGSQFYYGTSADSNGFAGIRAQLAGSVAAGGTTSSTSAYLLWMDSQQGVRFDVGMDGVLSINGPQIQQITDPTDSTKSLFAWVGGIEGYVGLTVGSDKSTWAITGITTTTNQDLTDTKAASLIANIPVARRNNLKWFINRTSQYTLEKSRSALGYQPAGMGGGPAWAGKPGLLGGYEIVLTDSITDTESN